MKSKYDWIITKDHIADKTLEPPCNCNAVGMQGPRDSTAKPDEIKKGSYFRMYDDDDILYYEGYIIGEFHGDEPLNDFGMGNAGCVRIEYPNDDT